MNIKKLLALSLAVTLSGGVAVQAAGDHVAGAVSSKNDSISPYEKAVRTRDLVLQKLADNAKFMEVCAYNEKQIKEFFNTGGGVSVTLKVISDNGKLQGFYIDSPQKLVDLLVPRDPYNPKPDRIFKEVPNELACSFNAVCIRQNTLTPQGKKLYYKTIEALNKEGRYRQKYDVFYASEDLKARLPRKIVFDEEVLKTFAMDDVDKLKSMIENGSLDLSGKCWGFELAAENGAVHCFEYLKEKYGFDKLSRFCSEKDNPFSFELGEIDYMISAALRGDSLEIMHILEQEGLLEKSFLNYPYISNKTVKVHYYRSDGTFTGKLENCEGTENFCGITNNLSARMANWIADNCLKYDEYIYENREEYKNLFLFKCMEGAAFEERLADTVDLLDNSENLQDVIRSIETGVIRSIEAESSHWVSESSPWFSGKRPGYHLEITRPSVGWSIEIPDSLLNRRTTLYILYKFAKTPGVQSFIRAVDGDVLSLEYFVQLPHIQGDNWYPMYAALLQQPNFQKDKSGNSYCPILFKPWFYRELYRQNSLDALACLMANGADVELAIGSKRETPLQFFLNALPKITKTEKRESQTPAEMQSDNNFNILKLFIDRMSNINNLNSEHLTALDIAAKLKLDKFVKYLVEYGAKLGGLTEQHAEYLAFVKQQCPDKQESDLVLEH